MKVRREDLKREIETALSGRDTQVNCASRLGPSYADFKRYIRRARAHGVDALIAASACGTHADEFKLNVVKSVVEEGLSKHHVAVMFNLNHGTVHAWVRKYIEGGAALLLSDNRGRRSMGRKKKLRLEELEPGSLEYLKLENEMLKRENLLLKKAQPLVREIIRNRSRGKSDTGSSEN